ncbi:MAG: hypothetical protein IJZ59_05900 [Alphaproteobacteria bacterium]|nr:hypothetical protein [Alphaproteobacteria bacterium]
MITEIDFFRLLHELQSLNVQKTDNETLINYVAKLEYVEEVFLSSSQKQQENFKSVFDKCMEYRPIITNELLRRRIEIRNIWDEISDNPEILVAALLSMPIIQLFDFIEQLKRVVKIDSEIQPLLDLAFRIVQARTSNGAVC